MSANVVRTAGGVGYLVQCAQPLAKGVEVELHVTTIVRDDAISLYGFADPLEQQCFADLIKAAGVGPQIALNLLRDLGVAGVARAIRDSDTATLRTVSGVGPALAKKLPAVVKLSKDVMAAADSAETATAAGDGAFDPMVEALVATLEQLGYDEWVARRAATTARRELPDGDESQVLSRALTLTREAA